MVLSKLVQDTTSTGKYKEPERKLVVSCGLCEGKWAAVTGIDTRGQGNAIN